MGEGLPAGLGRFVVLSMALHLAAFVGALGVGQLHLAKAAPVQTVLVTKLVRLGKERPPELLPRKPEAPPPAAKPVAAVTPQVEVKDHQPAAKPESLPSAKDRIAQLSQVSKALERLKKQGADEPEGLADGVRDGEVSRLAQAMAGNQFATEVYRCIKQYYSIEGMDQSRVRDRSAVVIVRIDTDGRFIEHRIERSSGLEAFDRAVDRAVIKCGKVSPPPSEISDAVRDGLEVVFQP
jgi:TonB family protein